MGSNDLRSRKNGIVGSSEDVLMWSHCLQSGDRRVVSSGKYPHRKTFLC